MRAIIFVFVGFGWLTVAEEAAAQTKKTETFEQCLQRAQATGIGVRTSSSKSKGPASYCRNKMARQAAKKKN